MYVVARTDAGLVRDMNQDHYVTWDFTVGISAAAERYVCCAVADGMGGSAAGDIASASTLNLLSERLLSALVSRCGKPDSEPCNVTRLLAESVDHANAAVKKMADNESALRGMGTTLTSALLSRGVLYLAQVGDSRCYRFRDGELQQQTEDHSLVGELVRMGRLSPEDARQHPQRNLITRAVGIDDDVEVDLQCQVVEEGDIYLLCSDGLWEMVPDSRIHDLLWEASRPMVGPEGESIVASTADRLLRAALEGGGDDNITVVIAVIEPEDVHPDASRDAQVFARTRVETASAELVDLKKTLRYRLQDWQQ